MLERELEPAPPETFALGERAREPEIQAPQLSPNAASGDVARAAFARSAESIVRYDAKLRLQPDETTIHQTRVAVRRLRSDLRAFLPLLEQTWALDLRARLSWLQDGLSAARDADVLIAGLKRQSRRLPDADRLRLDTLLVPFAAARTAACERLHEMLHEPAYARLLQDIVDAANHPPLTALASEPACDVVPSIIDGAWSTLRKRVRKSSRPPSDRELHGIRIAAKRVRYAAEAVEPVAGRPVRSLARRVAAMQTTLGEQHDAVVACRALRELTGEHAFLAGELAVLEVLAGQKARESWRTAWRKARRAHRRFFR